MNVLQGNVGTYVGTGLLTLVTGIILVLGAVRCRVHSSDSLMTFAFRPGWLFSGF
jgi:hypothetical protein